jgi:hypothetical protein
MNDDDDQETEKFHMYVASWDSLGFEAIINITKMERDSLMAALKNENSGNPASILRNMILRAKFNTQRFPQIWGFKSNVSVDTLWEIAKEQPQMLADLIKNHGEKIFGDPVQKRVIE